MKSLRYSAMAAALLLVIGATLTGWTSAQTSDPGLNMTSDQQASPVSRYTVVSSESATVLLDTETGQTWLLAGVEWLPIGGGPDRPTMSRGEQTHAFQLPQGDWARLSPFTEVVCQPDDSVLVRMDDEERLLQLVSIDEIPAGEIIATSRSTYRDSWEKRFVEDLVEVLAGMEHRTGETVALLLRDPDSGETRLIDEAPMTRDNRRKVYAARNGN